MLFDGTCALCDGTVRALHWLDADERLWFAPLQGETARRLGLVADVSAAGSVLVVHEVNGEVDECYERSAAALQALRVAGGLGWLAVALAAPVPRALREGIYRWVARNRYRWFGRKHACHLPSATLRRRLLG